MKRILMRLSLCPAILLLCFALVHSACAAETEAPKSAKEAVDEMIWGVNLADLYMADIRPEDGATNGYDNFTSAAELGMAAWFWDESFDWLTYHNGGVDGYMYHDAYSGTFTVSVKLPDYRFSTDSPLFWIGFMAKQPEQVIDITLSGSRLVKSDGSEVPLPVLDKTYRGNVTAEADKNGWYSYIIWEDSGLPEESADLNGATFYTTVTIGEDSCTVSKTDYYFQLQRTPMDQEALTDLFIDQGANVFRLPVTWTWFVNDQTFEIDREWLDAVKTEVDYILDQDAYCILNMHDDYLERSFASSKKDSEGRWTDFKWTERWMDPEYSQYVDERFAKVWEQIAEYFQGYSQKLIFETCNEPTTVWHEDEADTWIVTQQARVNELNSLFVNTVRKTDKTRLLCLAVAEYNQHQRLSALTLPENDPYLMVQIHSYNELEGGENYTVAGYDPKYDYVGETDLMFTDVRSFQVSHPDIPVIMGEVGISHSKVISDSEKAERVGYLFQKATESGVPCLWWEDYFPVYEDSRDRTYWLYDKTEQRWGRPEILKAIQDNVKQAPARIFVETSATDSGVAVKVRLTAQQTGNLVCAVYDGDNRMRRIATQAVEENSTARLEIACQAGEAAVVKVFFLDAGWIPRQPVSTYPVSV